MFEQLSPAPGFPRHPDFSSLVTRYSSFNGRTAWDLLERQRLAEAGFFCYKADVGWVKCFFCGGVLWCRAWTIGRSPREQHVAILRTDCHDDIQIYSSVRSAANAPNQGDGQRRNMIVAPNDGVYPIQQRQQDS